MSVLDCVLEVRHENIAGGSPDCGRARHAAVAGGVPDCGRANVVAFDRAAVVPWPSCHEWMILGPVDIAVSAAVSPFSCQWQRVRE